MNYMQKPFNLFTIMLLALTMTFTALPLKAAAPTSFDWGSSGPSGFGVLDADNTTILQTGDLVQFIWTGADGTIDPSECSTGNPTDDDQLLATSTVQNGGLPPTLANKGLVTLSTYSYDTADPQNGGTVYLRAWNDSTAASATHYGDSSTSTLTALGSFNAPSWNTDTNCVLAVTLADFSATSQQDHIEVTWQTVSELDHLGFNVWRSLTEEIPDTQLNAELIPSQAPGSGQGGSYEWVDNDIEPGVTYYYWLEDVDVSGVTTRHGPVSVTTSVPTAITLHTLNVTMPLVWPIVLAGLALLMGLMGLMVRSLKWPCGL